MYQHEVGVLCMYLFPAWLPSVHRKGSFSLPEAGVSSLLLAAGAF